MAELSLDLLSELLGVVGAPLLDIAPAFSAMLAPMVPHTALVIFTEDCTGRPQKKAGEATIIDHVTLRELDTVRSRAREVGSVLTDTTAVIAHEQRRVSGWVADTGALLVLVEPARFTEITRDVIGALWQIVAVVIRQQVGAARPDYLRDSRMASTERARVIAELTDAHSTTLELLLSVLRSRDTADDAARRSATDIAATAMVNLRAVTDRDRSLSEEPVASAFERLREDLRPLARFGNLDVQFIEPPTNGRALPGEVAHAGRAIVRGSVLALIDQPGVGRVRVQWDCDGSNLLINIRDDGPGGLTTDTPSVRQLKSRVDALDGSLRVDAVAGWGSTIQVALPLDSPALDLAPTDEWSLTARERAVLQLVASGARNRAIATSLSISENTVKFHVANLLRKASVSNRAELAALVR